MFLFFRCVRLDFLWMMLFCNNNQTNRYLICCSDKDFCNDRDAYASDIRKELMLIDNLDGERVEASSTKPNRDKFIFLIVGFVSLFFGLIFIFMLIFYFIRKRFVYSKKQQSKTKNEGETFVFFCSVLFLAEAFQAIQYNSIKRNHFSHVCVINQKLRCLRKTTMRCRKARQQLVQYVNIRDFSSQ